jgi:F-type H+-transporting ATPase subunit delta
MTQAAAIETIARPYAKAAFAVAKRHNAIPEWQHCLEALAICIEDSKMQRIIHHPAVPAEQLRACCLACTKGQENGQWTRFVSLLVERKRLVVAAAILRAFMALKAAEEDIINVTIETPVALSNDDLARLVTALEKKWRQKVKASVEINMTLLGGVCIRAGDRVIDASLRGRLDQLHHQLLNAAVPNE